uniref:Magnesium transporter n=1 Tax=candidate division WWE3 bacterium TaxID=2053526 RepID=A0A831Z0U9_UNCKA
MAERKDIALNHIIADVPTARAGQRVGEVLDYIRKKNWESSHHVFVVDSKDKYLGVLSTRILLSSPDEKRISEIFNKNYPSVGPQAHENSVAILAIRHDLDTVPVVHAETGKFLGTVDAEELLRILHEEHAEKLLRRAGILIDTKVVDIFKARVFRLIRFRLPWLIFGFGGGLLITIFVSQFERLLQAHVALAYFIPIVAYMNAAVGTQAVSLFVRGLALEKISMRRYIFRELAVGMSFGVLFGGLIFLFAWFAFGSLGVAATVGISLFLGIVLSTSNAMLTPYIFHRLGKDPAFGSDPLVTIAQDVLSVLIYFAVASILVF